MMPCRAAFPLKQSAKVTHLFAPASTHSCGSEFIREGAYSPYTLGAITLFANKFALHVSCTAFSTFARPHFLYGNKTAHFRCKKSKHCQ